MNSFSSHSLCQQQGKPRLPSSGRIKNLSKPLRPVTLTLFLCRFLSPLGVLAPVPLPLPFCGQDTAHGPLFCSGLHLFFDCTFFGLHPSFAPLCSQIFGRSTVVLELTFIPGAKSCVATAAALSHPRSWDELGSVAVGNP